MKLALNAPMPMATMRSTIPRRALSGRSGALGLHAQAIGNDGLRSEGLAARRDPIHPGGEAAVLRVMRMEVGDSLIGEHPLNCRRKCFILGQVGVEQHSRMVECA